MILNRIKKLLLLENKTKYIDTKYIEEYIEASSELKIELKKYIYGTSKANHWHSADKK